MFGEVMIKLTMAILLSLFTGYHLRDASTFYITTCNYDKSSPVWYDYKLMAEGFTCLDTKVFVGEEFRWDVKYKLIKMQLGIYD
jgi:hypothetical protein